MPNQVSDSLRRNSEKIMTLWQTRAQEEITAAFYQSTLALRNSLPEYLTQMVDALSSTIKRTPYRISRDKDESTRVGKKHGRERGQFAGYSIDQLIYEYHILRQTIFEVLEEEGPLSQEARDIIIDSIEQAVNDAATQFSETVASFHEQVSATVTHDLRTPITAAKMTAQMMLRIPEQNENTVRFSKRIVQNMERVDMMIHDLLDANRVQSGQTLELKFEKMDFISLVSDVSEDLNTIFGNRVKVNSEPSIVGYWGKQALWRVLENLITNAFKYGAKDTLVDIKVSCSENRLHFSVHNTGNPIPGDEIGILFDRYSRSRSSKGTKGWGIGLSLVKGLVEAHKGKVGVQSSKEEGTTFFVDLPKDCRNVNMASSQPLAEPSLTF